MIKETSAGALIFYIENSKPIFLLLKYPSYWGFVKGIIEKDEEELHTIKREAKEEADISDIRFLEGFRQVISYFFKFNGQIVSKQIIFLLGEINKEQAEKVKISSEYEGFKWAGFEDAMKVVKHKNEKDLLTKANEFFKEYLNQKRL